MNPAESVFREGIAEGDDAVATDLTLIEALAVLELAIVDDSTGVLVDEGSAKVHTGLA